MNLTIGVRPNKKNIESLNLTRKKNLLRLWCGKNLFGTWMYVFVFVGSSFYLCTVGENIIATTKIRNNYGAIKSFIFQYCESNIELFSITSCKFITLNPLCILFGISSFFDGFLSKVIAFPTIAIALVVALSCS